jgi:hypothetical protein
MTSALVKALRAGCIATAGLSCVFLLAGCASGGSSGQSQDFQDGYSGGCYNGKIAAGFDEPYSDPDSSRYGVDPQYTEGWKAGYTECFERFRQFPDMGDKRQ